MTKYDFIKSHFSEDGDRRLMALGVLTTFSVILLLRVVSELKWESRSRLTLGPRKKGLYG